MVISDNLRVGRGRKAKKSSYTRTCKICGNFYKTSKKKSKICGKCNKSNDKTHYL